MIFAKQATGLPARWRYIGAGSVNNSETGGWWDTGRGVHVLVSFRQIIAALDWSRGWNEEPDVWVATV